MAIIWSTLGWRPRKSCRFRSPWHVLKVTSRTGKSKSRHEKTGARITVTHSVEEAVTGADAVYTDVWASMGQEEESTKRIKAFRDYQVNERVVAMAKKDAVVMHCLPAHRGQEITHEVLEGPQCIAFDQAENRLHVQKAIMVWLLRSFKDLDDDPWITT